MKRLTSDKRMLEYGLMKPYPNISCFSTTRHGGCSEGTYASFNCTHYCGDLQENVEQNKRLLSSLLAQPPRALVIPRQTHSTNVRIVASIPEREELEDVDALVTREQRLCLCISTADCIPVLLYDEKNQVIAAAHAGWRGTVGCIVGKTVETMKEYYGTDGKDVMACIGPGISLEAFEVGDEVYAAFEEAGLATAVPAEHSGHSAGLRSDEGTLEHLQLVKFQMYAVNKESVNGSHFLNIQ